jgi:hypothetical protein
VRESITRESWIWLPAPESFRSSDLSILVAVATVAEDSAEKFALKAFGAELSTRSVNALHLPT